MVIFLLFVGFFLIALALAGSLCDAAAKRQPEQDDEVTWW